MSQILEAYETYLESVEKFLLKKYFEQQKDYIHCKEGCAHCCKSGEYPFSKLELQYLMQGYNDLTDKEKNAVQEKIKKLKKDKAKCSDEVFLYECPFLINNRCCIYKYRGLVCRTHGLPFFVVDDSGNSRNKLPYCINLGLNYSNVYDKQRNTLSRALWKKSNIATEPVVFNLSNKTLTQNAAVKDLGLEFGEQRTLIDWFIT